MSSGFHVYGKLKRVLGGIENEGKQNISALAFCTVYRTAGQKFTSPLTYGSSRVRLKPDGTR